MANAGADSFPDTHSDRETSGRRATGRSAGRAGRAHGIGFPIALSGIMLVTMACPQIATNTLDTTSDFAILELSPADSEVAEHADTGVEQGAPICPPIDASDGREPHWSTGVTRCDGFAWTACQAVARRFVDGGVIHVACSNQVGCIGATGAELPDGAVLGCHGDPTVCRCGDGPACWPYQLCWAPDDASVPHCICAVRP
jgi:hypothetical protein